MKLEWFNEGRQFRPRVLVKDFRMYNDEVSRLRDSGGSLLDIREAQSRFVAAVLSRSSGGAAVVQLELSIPEVVEAFRQLEDECFPGLAPECPKCGYDLRAPAAAAEDSVEVRPLEKPA